MDTNNEGGKKINDQPQQTEIQLRAKRMLREDDGAGTSSKKQKSMSEAKPDNWNSFKTMRKKLRQMRYGPRDPSICQCREYINKEKSKDPNWDGPPLSKALYFQLCNFHTVDCIDEDRPCIGNNTYVNEIIWSYMSEKRLAQAMLVCREWARAIPYFVNDTSVRRRWTWFDDNPNVNRIKRPVRVLYASIHDE